MIDLDEPPSSKPSNNKSQTLVTTSNIEIELANEELREKSEAPPVALVPLWIHYILVCASG